MVGDVGDGELEPCCAKGFGGEGEVMLGLRLGGLFGGFFGIMWGIIGGLGGRFDWD